MMLHTNTIITFGGNSKRTSSKTHTHEAKMKTRLISAGDINGGSKQTELHDILK